MAYELPSLPYSYDALEPFIDAKTMEIHHSKHHAAYVAKTNAALENFPKLAATSITDVLSNLDAIPSEVRQAVINNGGGVANHNLFWQIMGPSNGGEPKGALADAIVSTFGSYDSFQTEFSTAAANQFGSGWAWLTVNPAGQLAVTSTANQNTPLSDGHSPILTLDVWEHAYYLHYQNRRPDYIKAWWNVVNWDKVTKLYDEAKS